MHRYVFPCDPNDDMIDLTADDRSFYFNEYSGELSLEFPKAERKCRGGILAYVPCLSQSYLRLLTSMAETVPLPHSHLVRWLCTDDAAYYATCLLFSESGSSSAERHTTTLTH